MKRALITGITGQDGSYLCEWLLEKGYDVQILDLTVNPQIGRTQFTRYIRQHTPAVVGITVIATMSDKPTAKLMANAMSLNSCPTSCSTRITGINTPMVVSVEANTAPHTSVVPL